MKRLCASADSNKKIKDGESAAVNNVFSPDLNELTGLR